MYAVSAKYLARCVQVRNQVERAEAPQLASYRAAQKAKQVLRTSLLLQVLSRHPHRRKKAKKSWMMMSMACWDPP